MECGANASGDIFGIIAFQHRILMCYCYQCCSRCRSGGILDERFADVECPRVQNRPERVIRYFSVHFSCGKRAQRMESGRYSSLEHCSFVRRAGYQQRIEERFEEGPSFPCGGYGREAVELFSDGPAN